MVSTQTQMEEAITLILKNEKRKLLEQRPRKEEFGYDEEGWWMKDGENQFDLALSSWYRRARVSKENITDLGTNEIFVFGSNLAGIHGAGAARFAYENFGAKYGKGEGITGSCYALPTKSREIKTLTLQQIKEHVDKFFELAKPNKEYTFLVTEVGCGYAGYTPLHIAPLFEEALHCNNVFLPERFWNVIVTHAK